MFICRDELGNLNLNEVLIHIRDHELADKDAWEMADHGLMILHNIRTRAAGRKISKQELSGVKKATGNDDKKLKVL